MKNHLGILARSDCVVQAVVSAGKDMLSFGAKVDSPFPSTLVEEDAKASAFVADGWPAHVMHVDAVAYISEICEPIVGRVAVDMVDVFSRPFTVDVKPSQPMREVLRVVDCDLNVPVVPDASGDAPSSDASTAHASRKDSCIWIVMKQFAKAFCRKIGFSHIGHPMIELVRAWATVQTPLMSALYAQQPDNGARQ